MYSYLRMRARSLRTGVHVYNSPLLLAVALDKLESLAQKTFSDTSKPIRAGTGCVVDLLDMGDESSVSVELVMPAQASPEKGLISVLSPLGSSLLGLKMGSVSRVELWGRSHRFQVLDIRRVESVVTREEETPS
jgi:transcription elongation factor GreA